MAEPKIRFSGFIGQWKQRKLGSLLILSNERNDGSYSRNDVLAAALGTELQKKQIFFGLKATDDSVKNYRVVKSGDVIYTKSPIKGFPNGIVRISKGVNGIVPSLYCVYHCSDSVVPSFIQLYFEDKTRLDAYLEPLVNVGARNNVNITDSGFLEGEICLPETVEEQQKIVDFLSSVDEVIAASEQEVANLETQKKAVMKKIFSQEVRFKREDGTDFPEWQKNTLGELAEFSKGQGYTKSDLSEEGSPIILYGRLYTKYQTVITEVDTFANKKEKSVLSKKGDVIVPASGETAEDISVAAVVDADGIILGGDINIIHPCSDVSPDYLAYSLTFGTPHQEMAKRAQGKSIVHLHNDDLKSANIVYPCLEEQRLIADFLSAFDEAIAAAKKELELWKELKKGLLQQMFV